MLNTVGIYQEPFYLGVFDKLSHFFSKWTGKQIFNKFISDAQQSPWSLNVVTSTSNTQFFSLLFPWGLGDHRSLGLGHRKAGGCSCWAVITDRGDGISLSVPERKEARRGSWTSFVPRRSCPSRNAGSGREQSGGKGSVTAAEEKLVEQIC